MTPEYATEIVEQPDGPRAPMRSHRRLDTVIHVSDGVVWVGRRERDRPAPGDEVVIPAGVSPLERG